jgi:hypothetical protein
VKLALRAAEVAVGALRALEGLEPLLGGSADTHSGYRLALCRLQALCRETEREADEITPANGKIYTPVSQQDIFSTLLQALRPPNIPKEVRSKPPSYAPILRLVEDVEEADPSEWDPEPLHEAKRCQALLLEIIRRATHDWVLYRGHASPDKKELARQAYVWLFEEEPGHKAWKEREKALFKLRGEGGGPDMVEVGTRRITSFLSICEIVGVDPDAVRKRAKEMTPESIMRTGRHAERRKPQTESSSIEAHGLVVDIDLDSLDADGEEESGYW